ncbi:MAG TPA: hypothetical protein VMR95_03795 [Candidatus Binatia bacterium]|nr:hypothetical protein [Candidatus Binatia bacterium]
MATTYKNEDDTLSQHDDLGVHPEHREAENEQWENRLNSPDATESGSAIAKRNQELDHIAQGEGNPVSKAPADESEKSKSPESLHADESAGGNTDKVGKGFSMAAATGGSFVLARKALLVVKKHGKGFAIGGGIGGVILAFVIIGFTFVLTHELLTIEANLLRKFTSIERHFERDADQTIAKHLACRAMANSCANAKDSADPADDANAAASSGDPGPLAEDMDKFSFTDPTIKDALANQGISVTGAGDDITMTDAATGEAITPDEIANDSSVADSFQTAIPADEVGQYAGNNNFEKVNEDNSDATFQGVSDTDNGKTTQEEIREDDSDGESPSDDAIDTTATGDTDNNTVPAEKGELGGAINAADTAIIDGESATAATQAGVNALEKSEEVEEGLSAVSILGDASIACSYERVIKGASEARIPTIIALLVRHGATLLSLADQLKSGHITGNAVNTTMQMLNGNPNATVSMADKGTANDDSLPFSASATWQQAIGNPNASASPGILASAKPTENAGQAVVDSITSLLSYSGGSIACGALTSTFGIAIQFAVGAFELATNIPDVGATEIGQLAASGAFLSTLQYEVLPKIVQYFTPVDLSGAENSVQTINNSGAGINLASDDYARSLGGEPLSNQDADSIDSETTQENQIAEANLPWTQRIFSMNNPQSLVSNLALDMPLSLGQLASKISDYLVGLPSALMRTIGSIFSGHIALAQTADSNPGTLYGVTQYGFTDSELAAQQDPITNEQYLYSSVPVPAQVCTTSKTVVKKKTVTTTSCGPTTYPVVRIDALGNPNTYTIQPDSDVNGKPVIGNSVEVNTTEPQWISNPWTMPNDNNDLLHCFVDGYTALQEPINDANNNCGGLGSYDATDITQTNTNPYYKLPSGDTAASIYCNVAPPPSLNLKLYSNSTCASMISNQTTNDVNDFRQYLLDVNVMNDYMSLTN